MNKTLAAFIFPLLLPAFIGSNALAQATPTSALAAAKPGAPSLSISPAAVEPVKVVDAFMAALSNADLKAAQKYLDPGVVIMSNGAVVGSSNDYINGQAKGDAAFLQKAQRQLLRRQAAAGPGFAYVLSEKVLRPTQPGKVPGQLVNETMVLVKKPDGWKIVHIHWSSRALPQK